MVGALCATLGAGTHRFTWCRPAAFVGDLGALVGRGELVDWAAGHDGMSLTCHPCLFHSVDS